MIHSLQEGSLTFMFYPELITDSLQRNVIDYNLLKSWFSVIE